MRYQCGVSEVRCEIRKVVFSGPIFARFVVLDAEVRELIAKRQEEVVLPVVGCAEQSSSFSNNPPIFFDDRRRRVQSFVTVRRDLKIVGRRSSWSELDSPEMTACKHRRIHKGRQGNGLELDGIAVGCLNRERRTELPIAR